MTCPRDRAEEERQQLQRKHPRATSHPQPREARGEADTQTPGRAPHHDGPREP